MAWQRLTVSLLASGLLLSIPAGCATGQSNSVASQVRTPDPGVSRLQKPDADVFQPHAGSTDSSPAESPAVPTEGEYTVRIRAKVNGVAILDEELRSTVYSALLEIRNAPEPQRSALQKKILNKALEHLIEREVILYEAFFKLKGPAGAKVIDKLKGTAGKEFDKQVLGMKKRFKCKSDEEFKQLVRSQGQSLDNMRREFERNFMATEYMRYRVMSFTDLIGLGDVYEYYKQHPSEFQTVDSVKWQDLFISGAKHGGREGARHFAQELASRAQAGEDFARLVDLYDDGDSRFRGGQGYGQRRGEIKPPEVEPHLFQLRDGQLGPLVELDTGVHIVRVVRREYAGLMPLDEKTQNAIFNKLKSAVAEREWKRILRELKSKAAIEVYP